MTGDDFREISLALEGTAEAAHMGHPDFRVNGRIFATLDAAERRGVVKLSPEEQRAVLRRGAAGFEPAPGAWGRQGWTAIRLDVADLSVVRGAVLLAWEAVSALKPRRSTKRVSKSGAKGKRS
jgi:predicted DNA-binding protein (MmcQ/YjbR family)